MTIERIIHIVAGTFILLSLLMGVPGSPLYMSSWWLAFTAFVGTKCFFCRDHSDNSRSRGGAGGG